MFSFFLKFFQEFCSYPLSLPFLLFAIFLYKSVFASSANGKNQPPSPPRLPIIGNLRQIGELPQQSFQSLSQRYGKIMLLHFGSKPVLVATTPEAAREILKTHDLIFCNRPESRVTSRLFYGCRDVGFSPYGEHWRMMKSLCIVQLLSNKKVLSYKNIREEEVALVIEEIKRSHFSVVNLNEIIKAQTYDLIYRAAFGRKYSSSDVGGTNFKELLKVTMELLGVFMIGDYIPWLGWIDRVKGLDGRIERVAKELDDFLDRVIKDHQNRRDTKKNKNDESEEGTNVVNCFVENMLEELKENKNALTMRDIKAVILDVFAAGTDTIFTLLDWTMAELIRHPRVMKVLQEEVRKFVGGKGCKLLVSEDDLKNLTYLKAVIKESLRLHPPAPLLVFRQPLQDAKIIGFDIAAGTHVYINAWAIHRDPTYWEEPEDFRPERFLDTTFTFNGQDDFKYIPFGGGRRICPGIAFSMANAELMLANLVCEFDWKISSECEDFDMTESVGINAHKQDPLMLIAIPYHC